MRQSRCLLRICSLVWPVVWLDPRSTRVISQSIAVAPLCRLSACVLCPAVKAAAAGACSCNRKEVFFFFFFLPLVALDAHAYAPDKDGEGCAVRVAPIRERERRIRVQRTKFYGDSGCEKRSRLGPRSCSHAFRSILCHRSLSSTVHGLLIPLIMRAERRL